MESGVTNLQISAASTLLPLSRRLLCATKQKSRRDGIHSSIRSRRLTLRLAPRHGRIAFHIVFRRLRLARIVLPCMRLDQVNYFRALDMSADIFEPRHRWASRRRTYRWKRLGFASQEAHGRAVRFALS